MFDQTSNAFNISGYLNSIIIEVVFGTTRVIDRMLRYNRGTGENVTASLLHGAYPLWDNASLYGYFLLKNFFTV